jgi:hypothetical protein
VTQEKISAAFHKSLVERIREAQTDAEVSDERRDESDLLQCGNASSDGVAAYDGNNDLVRVTIPQKCSPRNESFARYTGRKKLLDLLFDPDGEIGVPVDRISLHQHVGWIDVGRHDRWAGLHRFDQFFQGMLGGRIDGGRPRPRQCNGVP